MEQTKFDYLSSLVEISVESLQNVFDIIEKNSYIDISNITLRLGLDGIQFIDSNGVVIGGGSNTIKVETEQIEYLANLKPKKEREECEYDSLPKLFNKTVIKELKEKYNIELTYIQHRKDFTIKKVKFIHNDVECFYVKNFIKISQRPDFIMYDLLEKKIVGYDIDDKPNFTIGNYIFNSYHEVKKGTKKNPIMKRGYYNWNRNQYEFRLPYVKRGVYSFEEYEVQSMRNKWDTEHKIIFDVYDAEKNVTYEITNHKINRPAGKHVKWHEMVSRDIYIWVKSNKSKTRNKQPCLCVYPNTELLEFHEVFDLIFDYLTYYRHNDGKVRYNIKDELFIAKTGEKKKIPLQEFEKIYEKSDTEIISL
ncbi:MAG: hypothetical protein CMF62_00945 [Magnetococcales bacterium]|nr:hypothetical protein [Magnetococcales bacterium]